MRRRFFVEQFAGNSAVMEGDTAHHLGRVLRAQQGQLYELSDGQRVCLARIEKVSRDRVDFALLEEIPAYQPRVEVTLLLAVVKFDAFEWAIEKATELGVSTIVPLAASRSEKALLASAGKRAERWKKILAEASQQSRRLRVPTLENLPRPAEALPAGRRRAAAFRSPSTPKRDPLKLRCHQGIRLALSAVREGRGCPKNLNPANSRKVDCGRHSVSTPNPTTNSETGRCTPSGTAGNQIYRVTQRPCYTYLAA